VKRFIREGLEADSPVGFLNLHSGGEPIPYHWHWMPIVKIEEIEGRTVLYPLEHQYRLRI